MRQNVSGSPASPSYLHLCLPYSSHIPADTLPLCLSCFLASPHRRRTVNPEYIHMLRHLHRLSRS